MNWSLTPVDIYRLVKKMKLFFSPISNLIKIAYCVQIWNIILTGKFDTQPKATIYFTLQKINL